jgi:hypothetical protein
LVDVDPVVAKVRHGEFLRIDSHVRQKAAKIIASSSQERHLRHVAILVGSR